MKKNDIKTIIMSEEKRPAIYTAMKYWGKKPHNIWREYIKTFSNENSVILDPFGGCGITAIEGMKAKRKIVVTDINPLMTFLFDVYSTKFEEDKLKKYADEIFNYVNTDKIYNKFYKKDYKGQVYTIQNFKWDEGKIYQIGLINDRNKLIINNCEAENKQFKLSDSIKFSAWVPNRKLTDIVDVDSAFIRAIGKDNINAIWTKRNLYVLSIIFEKIIKIKPYDIKLQLLFAFIQSLLLTSKMCVPRREKSNRDFSTSWGRPAYICSKRQMEMNPLLVFRKNCTGKQSASSSLKALSQYFDTQLSYNCINKSKKVNLDYRINYGIYDAKKINTLIKNKSIDLIITDPPYGGMIHYCDLSYVWNCWLERYNNIYKTDFNNEVVIKNKTKDKHQYLADLTICINNFYYMLKDDGKLVITFNSKDIELWSTFIKSIVDGGFYINKVMHQQNLRSSEANVYDSSGTSGTDYYLVCSKFGKDCTKKELSYKKFTEEIFNIVKNRNEDTPTSVIIDYFINKIISSEIICPKFNILKEINKINNDKMYYNCKNKSICLKKYDKKKTLTQKIKEYINKNYYSSYQDMEVAVYKKFYKILRPEKQIIKKLYNEVINEK